MAKIYTARGDTGETDLMGGKRVPKDDLQIAALGEIDELNAVIGVAMTTINDSNVLGILHRIQNDLFTVGSDLSIAPGKKLKMPRVSGDNVKALESDIDSLTPPRVKEFVFPGGSTEAAELHLARAVARRAERAVVALSHYQSVNPSVLEYLNRLSTLLYVLALNIKKVSGLPEEHPTYESSIRPSKSP